MKQLHRNILEQLIAGSAEPILVARTDRADWPVVLSNKAFGSMAAGVDAMNRPFADVVEEIIGRELAVEVSESVRLAADLTLPVENGGQKYLLVLKFLTRDTEADARFCAAYWRGIANSVTAAADNEAQAALLKANWRIRDLSREDPVTGLLNENAFQDVLVHDWAVAAREKSRLSLVGLALDDFDDYLAVFGRHAADSCQRRVAQAIKRCLRRASDVAARITGPGGDRFVVLTHASDGDRVSEFAGRIAASVRELGIHHPRSSTARFVTVSYVVSVEAAGNGKSNAADFLQSVMKP